MRPLFSYYGGKQRLSSKIVKLLPRHTVYVEPFCGGAAVFFAKPWPPVTGTDHYREVLNDTDYNIVNLYRVVQDKELFERFFRIVSVPYSRSVFDVAKQRAKRSDLKPSVKAAAAYWVNIQQAFAHIQQGGWGTSVYGRNSALTWLNQINRLPECLDRLMGVHVECKDALDVIRRWDSPQTLFYCDPPYPGTRQGDYSGYTQRDFRRLCNLLDCSQGSFVLSCYENEAVRPSWDKHEFAAVCTAATLPSAARDRTREGVRKNSKRKECVWVVDRSCNARKEVKKIWRTWALKGFRWGGDPRNYEDNNE